MRITIGGALLFASAGGFAVLGPLKSMSPSIVKDQISGLEQSITWVESYFKGGQPVETAPISLPQAETKTEPAPALPILPEPIAAPEVPVENAAPVLDAAPPAPAVKHGSRRHRRHKVVAAVPVVAAAVEAPVKKTGKKAAAKKSAGSEMVGLYVALQLKSGREVKGVLKEKSATQYTIELPGMGPFQYPVDNVLGIKPVE